MQYLTELTGGKRNLVELYRISSELFVKKTIHRNSRFNFYLCERDTLLALNGTSFTPEIIDFNDDNNVILLNFAKQKIPKSFFQGRTIQRTK